uniref:Uncharacterized protein n=1 Tax=Onchocerca volvulus TaxID=6282 RepID=A0A2K6VYF5_ONCVO
MKPGQRDELAIKQDCNINKAKRRECLLHSAVLYNMINKRNVSDGSIKQITWPALVIINDVEMDNRGKAA